MRIGRCEIKGTSDASEFWISFNPQSMISDGRGSNEHILILLSQSIHWFVRPLFFSSILTSINPPIQNWKTYTYPLNLFNSLHFQSHGMFKSFDSASLSQSQASLILYEENKPTQYIFRNCTSVAKTRLDMQGVFYWFQKYWPLLGCIGLHWAVLGWTGLF